MDNKPPVPASAAGANGIGEADSMQRLDSPRGPVEIRAGLWYGGRGPGGEYYSKDMAEDESEAIWVRERAEVRWLPEELEAIAADMRQRAIAKSSDESAAKNA